MGAWWRPRAAVLRPCKKNGTVDPQSLPASCFPTRLGPASPPGEAFPLLPWKDSRRSAKASSLLSLQPGHTCAPAPLPFLMPALHLELPRALPRNQIPWAIIRDPLLLQSLEGTSRACARFLCKIPINRGPHKGRKVKIRENAHKASRVRCTLNKCCLGF